MTKRYHVEKGLPGNIELPNGIFPLRYSAHALERAKHKQIWVHRLPAFLDTKVYRLVDIEVTNGVLTACGYRGPWTSTTDIVLVVQIEELPWLVRTVYTNYRYDYHESIDLSGYDTPDN